MGVVRHGNERTGHLVQQKSTREKRGALGHEEEGHIHMH